MGRIRLRKKDRNKAAPGGATRAIYVWGKRKKKWEQKAKKKAA